eukprot:TRINITY_DN235_c0_g1_i5.p3 TRINITY_DN235_c0_g1~~TRINITY_DN235_c0_g1_i5.p3  ORF type:complete len:135 (-),score=0.30 TRINITY_DN235_c0_g1_i5:467-871(-)
MPWHQEAMKDVVGCDKPRLGAKHPLIRGFLNGETQPELCPVIPWLNSQALESQPGEVKHLSTRRKRNQKRFPQQRRANRDQPKPYVHPCMRGCGTAIRDSNSQQNELGSSTIEGDSPVCEGENDTGGTRVGRGT